MAALREEAKAAVADATKEEKAYGFRNIQNMLDLVYLVCSDLRVPLPNRKPRGAKSA